MRQRGQNDNQIGIYGPWDQETPGNQDIRIRGRSHGARGGCSFGTGCGVKNAPVEKTIMLVCVGTLPIVPPPVMARINLNP